MTAAASAIGAARRRIVAAAAALLLTSGAPSLAKDDPLQLAATAPTLEHIQRNINLAQPGGPKPALDNALARVFNPRRDTTPFTLAYPLDWAVDPFKDPNWQFQLHALRMIDPLIVAYTNKPSDDLLDRIVEVAADWQRFHLVQGKRAKYSYYDMSIGIRAQKIAWLVRALHDAGRTEQLDTIGLPLARDTLQALQGQLPFSTTNHGLFQLHGLMALCRTLDGPLCASGQASANSEFARLLTQQFLADGMHSEHSPGYQYFAYVTFSRLVRSGWYGDAAEATRRLNLAKDHFGWLVDPAGLMFALGDTEATPPPLPSPFADASACELTAEPCVRYRHFPDTGWVIARSVDGTPAEQGSALFVQGAHHSDTHKHLDDLSVIWFDRGQPVLVDPGKYAYRNDAMRAYAVSTRAHNTVEIDGTSSLRGKEAAYGSAIRAADARDGVLQVEASVHHAPVDTRHTRRITYAPNRYLDIVDTLSASRAREFVHWFQFPPGASVAAEAAADEPLQIALPGGDVLFVRASRRDCAVQVHSGSETPRMQGWYSPKYGESVPALSLGYACRGRDSTLSVRFAWNRDDLFDATLVPTLLPSDTP